MMSLKSNDWSSVFAFLTVLFVFNRGMRTIKEAVIKERKTIVVCHPKVLIENKVGAININWPKEAEAAAIPIAIDFFSGGAVLPIIATIVDIPPAPRPIPVIKPKLKIIKSLDGLLKI